jgi:hypothetical protein
MLSFSRKHSHTPHTARPSCGATIAGQTANACGKKNAGRPVLVLWILVLHAAEPKQAQAQAPGARELAQHARRQETKKTTLFFANAPSWNWLI